MIPKIIHYCWFGGKEKPQDVLKCIESWKKYLPDYEIKEWNESNYDFTKNQYMHDAYKEKKWAFVSDYARLDVVYKYGGIYLDTDVEVIKSFDSLLQEDLFCGFESRDPIMDKLHMQYEESVAFGLGFGAKINHPIIKEILDIYSNLSFYNSDGSLNLIACPYYQTIVLKRHGLIPNRQTQRFNNGIAFSPEYFCPQSNITDEMLYLTGNTYSIHHFSASWTKGRTRTKLRNKLRKIIGYRLADLLTRVIFYPTKFIKDRH